ncbi:MAG: type II toxin-antitoxin system VapC family toxin [Patescibacteria group bacterium]
MSVLLDTNIVIEYLKTSTLRPPIYKGEFIISVITEAELFRFSGMSESDIKIIRLIVETCETLAVDSRIARRAGELGRTRKTRLPDLLIAATALEYGIPLITHNLRDFKNIPDLIVRSSI